VTHSKYTRGFTLFEILIVIAFMAIMGTIGIGYYLNYYRQTILKTTTDKIVAFVYETQQKSINQQDLSQWGVHFENPSGDDVPFYASFKGSTYSEASEQKFLDGALDYIYPADGESVDVVFSKITGKVSDAEFKKVYIQLRPGVATKAVKISPAGVLSQDNGEVGWWKFDEGTGTIAADSSGYGNKGTISGNVAWVTGCKHGETACLNFSSGGYVDFGTSDHFSLPGVMTMSAWVNLDESASTYTIGGRAGASTLLTNYWMDITSNTQISFGGYTPAGGGAYVSGNYTFSTGTWYHLAGVDDGLRLRIYVNGKEEANGERADRITDTWSVTAGKKGGISSYFDGRIDDFRLYDRALTEDEIKELYESTK